TARHSGSRPGRVRSSGSGAHHGASRDPAIDGTERWTDRAASSARSALPEPTRRKLAVASGERSASRQHHHFVADADHSGLDHPEVDAPKVPIPPPRIGHEPERFLTEPGLELLASVVRFRGHFEERFPDPEAASDREIPLGEIEVDEEIVSEQL